MAAPAIRGLRKPQAASGMAATLLANAHARFSWIVRNVLRARVERKSVDVAVEGGVGGDPHHDPLLAPSGR